MMVGYRAYASELALIGATMVIGALGFWDIYFGASANPQPHHHLHLVTTYLWMGLLVMQIVLLARGDCAQHRRWGLAVLALGPVLVASAAMLTNHSAHRAIVSGRPDMLLVPNVVGTLWLAMVLLAAFVVRKRRRLHGAFLMSTLVLFQGPALFFALIAFAPPFRIEGPETFYRFGMAAMTGLALIVLASVLLFLRDRRNNWPYLFAAASFPLAQATAALLSERGLTIPLLHAVGAPDRASTFAITWAVVGVLLAALVLPGRSGARRRPLANEPIRAIEAEPAE